MHPCGRAGVGSSFFSVPPWFLSGSSRGSSACSLFLLVCFSGSFPFRCLLLNSNLVLLLPLVLLLVLLLLLVLVPYTCGLAFLTDKLRRQRV